MLFMIHPHPHPHHMYYEENTVVYDAVYGSKRSYTDSVSVDLGCFLVFLFCLYHLLVVSLTIPESYGLKYSM